MHSPLSALKSKTTKAVVKTVYSKRDRRCAYEIRFEENQRKIPRLIDCPFTLVLRLKDDDNRWHADSICEGRHNHDPSPISTHPSSHHWGANSETRSNRIPNECRPATMPSSR
jgi:hypothetical protein